MMYNQTMKTLSALFLIIIVLSSPAFAEETAYDFEIIIFEDKSGRYAKSELWQHELLESGRSPDEAQRNPGASKELDSHSNISTIGGIGLKRYADALKTNKRYNVLVHKAWRQTGFEEDKGIDIPIDSRTSTGPDKGGNSIQGSIRIELGRYLHIYTDMIYQQPNKDYNPALIGEESLPYKQYPIQSHRRMRSKELHYLDHPLVGILVMARPVDNENT